MKIPTLNQINKYRESSSINDILAFFFNMDWWDCPTGCFIVITIHALIEEAEKSSKKARVIMSMPEGEGYTFFDFCPVEKKCYVSDSEEMEDCSGFVMNKEINDMMYVSEWKLCNYHENVPPELALVHDSATIETPNLVEQDSTGDFLTIGAFELLKNLTIRPE